MLLALFQIADFLLQMLGLLIIVQVIISWLFAFRVIDPTSPRARGFAEVLERLTAPLYAPIRKIMPDFGGIDFSPLVLLILIHVLRRLLAGMAMDLAYYA
ncbi:MAG TPA: YggT family protein [Sphingomicrobium sp.]|jgi:YggT family protein|nr:YggT family protein [Sphingomicrobium sp.]